MAIARGPRRSGLGLAAWRLTTVLSSAVLMLGTDQAIAMAAIPPCINYRHAEEGGHIEIDLRPDPKNQGRFTTLTIFYSGITKTHVHGRLQRMRDHTAMSDHREHASNAWGLHVMAELNTHVCDAVADLLPQGLEMLAVNLQFVMEKRNAAGAALHPQATERDGVVHLFRGTGINADTPAIELPPSQVPPRPERVVTVG